jgi:hypothetical protein
VCEACDRLVVVAKDLADAEYEDFPDIADEVRRCQCNFSALVLNNSTTQIKFAASDVGRASSTLTTSVRNLQNTKDRAGAWAKLVDSAKVIAEMTVLLLQIVYGAEVKRIYAMERRANAQVVAVDISMVEEVRNNKENLNHIFDV